MKYLPILLLICLGCARTNESQTSYDSLSAPDTLALPVTEPVEGQAQLERFLASFDSEKESLPLVKITKSDEMNGSEIEYFFDGDFLVWAHISISGEGGYWEEYLVNKSPEETIYMHYGGDMPGVLGFIGNDAPTWYKVSADRDGRPFVEGPGDPDMFEYEIEFEDYMTKVRENIQKFVLKDGTYEWIAEFKKYKGEYGPAEKEVKYQFSESLYKTNLLSSTSIGTAFIQGYLGSWYPIYDDGSGKMNRHILCGGSEDVVELVAEAGQYLWKEKIAGDILIYQIVGFEESEGDAFYATVSKDGNRIKKTVVITENDGLLLVDGRPYTPDQKKYEAVTMKCD